MPRILINALSSTAGGGTTYLKNVLPRLERFDVLNHYVVLVPPEHFDQYKPFASKLISIETVHPMGGAAGRLLWEQTFLRSFVRKRKIGVLVSLGNFAVLGARVPQVLFSRNDLYFSTDFEQDLKARGRQIDIVSHRLKSRLACASIRQAQINITPTAAFAARIRSHEGMDAVRFDVVPFGFDPEVFLGENEPLSEEQLRLLNPGESCRRLLYVSNYNYFRNFETLIRALPFIRGEIRERENRDVQLILTTDIRQGAVYGGYDSSAASQLIDQLGLRDHIAMLGPVDYHKLHHLYRMSDVFVCPSYSESFGHPLVEAMASGVPVVSANLPVHREVCEDAAVYFRPFDVKELVHQCVRVLTEPRLAETMRARGRERVRHFSWDDHVRKLVRLVERCLPYRAAVSKVFPV